MSIYDIEVTTIEGQVQKMDAYRGRTLLVVNVASKCGFTPQYEGLQALYDRYKDTGFAVLGFPCDQFGHQEPGDETEFGALLNQLQPTSVVRQSTSMAVFPSLYKHLKSEEGVLGSSPSSGTSPNFGRC
jgi:glutathione peroxidase